MSALDDYNGRNYFQHPLGMKAPGAVITTYATHGYTPLDIIPGNTTDAERMGTPIYSMTDGVVTAASYNLGSTEYDAVVNLGGNAVTIRATNTLSQAEDILTGEFLIVYCHMVNPDEPEYANFPKLEVGQTVKKGDIIGGMGASGHTEGSWYVNGHGLYAHLHLDIKPLIKTDTQTYAAYHNAQCAGQAAGDRLGYAIFSQEPVYIKIAGSSDTPPPGGIEYNPTAYSNPANAQYRAGVQYEPAINSEYGTRTFSRDFMGVYPETLTHLDNNFPLKVLYVGAKNEFGENEYGISYGKLYRTWILHQPYQYYNYRTEGATLADFANEWDKLTSVWTSGARHDKQEAQQKTDWNLDFAQKLYNNIRYGPAYGLTLPETIAAFQCWPWTNETLDIGIPDVRSDMINIAPQPIIPNSGGYYTMYNRSGNFATARNNPTNPAVISSSEEHTHEERDGAHYFDGLVVVNKSYPMSQAAISAVGGLKSETQSAFNQMKQAWEAYVRTHSTTGSTNMFITSGYRTYADQQSIYNSYPASTRDTYSARPGYSEHHTGYAIDITLASSDPSTGFIATCRSMAEWLEQHCWEYGFILRYPQNKQSITGYIYEPWHFRYVGVENAQKFKGTTMEEYFNINSKY